jgi:hypothetical protein
MNAMSNTPQTGPQNDGDGTAGMKKPRGRPFTGPDDPRNRQNIEAAWAAAGDVSGLALVGPVEPGTQLYRDMLHVYSRPKGQDRTQGHRDCRRWKDRDLKGFMAKLADLEKAQIGAKPAAPPGEPEGPGTAEDPGTDRALALIDRLLSEGEASRNEEDARLAAQPGAAQKGRALQEELRAALWRERQGRELREKAREGIADPAERKITRILEESAPETRAEYCELAIHQEPGKILASLENALKATADSEEWLARRALTAGVPDGTPDRGAGGAS